MINPMRTWLPRPTGRLAVATALLVASLLGWATPAAAQLRLDITQGVRDAVPIAVVPFAGQTEGAPNEVARLV